MGIDAFKCLVVLDIDKIHRYVFHPHRLKFIRGGSLLLDDFIREKLKNMLSGPSKPYGDHETVYARGGAAEILFAELDHARQFVEDVTLDLEQASCTATITCRVEEKQPWDTYKNLQERAMQGLQRQKRDQRSAVAPISSPYVKFCEQCGVYPATDYHITESNGYLCETCRLKIEADRKGGSIELENQFLQHPLLKKDSLAKDFETIAQTSTPANYLGLVYLDGNRMGEKKKALLEDDPNDYQRLGHFSQKVEKAIFESVCEAIHEQMDHMIAGAYPVAFCLAGGDDVILVLPAHKALETALLICEKCEEKTDHPDFDFAKITLSAGVVLAKGNFPFSAMVDMAEQLLKSAKAESWKLYRDQDQDVSFLDFQLLDSGLRRLEDIRKENPTASAALNARPLDTRQARELIKHVAALKSWGLPLGRIKKLHGARYKGKHQAVLEYLLMLTRLPQEQRLYLCEYFPETESDLLNRTAELLELYDFIAPADLS